MKSMNGRIYTETRVGLQKEGSSREYCTMDESLMQPYCKET